jgi:hypothetical protein
MAADAITILPGLSGFSVTQYGLEFCHVCSYSSRSGAYGETV